MALEERMQFDEIRHNCYQEVIDTLSPSTSEENTNLLGTKHGTERDLSFPIILGHCENQSEDL